MSTPSSYSLKSPFDVLQLLPEGHEKALKQAVYNTGAIICVLVVFFMGVMVFHIMQPFLRPLVWALLCGSAIYPFKRELTLILRGWLNNLSANGTPLLVGTVMLPFSIFDNTSELFASFVIHYFKNILILIACIGSLFGGYYFLPVSFFSWLYTLFDLTIYILNTVIAVAGTAQYLTWSLVVGFLVLVWFCWPPQSKIPLASLSTFIWISVVCTLVSATGPLALPVLVVFAFLTVLGFFLEINIKELLNLSSGDETDDGHSSVKDAEEPRSFFESLKHGIENFFLDSSRKPDDKDGGGGDSGKETSRDDSGNQEHDEDNEKLQLDPPTPEKMSKSPRKPTKIPFKSRTRKRMLRPHRLSTLYLSGVVWACVLAELWHHLWLLVLLLIPSLYIISKRIGYHFGLWKLVTEWASNNVGVWFVTRKDVLFPAPLRGTWKLLRWIDSQVHNTLEKSVDTFTSIGVISLLLICTVLGTIFMSIQVYGESVHLVEVTGSVINRTLILPENFRDIDAMLDSMVGDAYLYGRQWISKSVQHLIDEKNENRAALVEKQLLALWDEAYRLWVSRNVNETVLEKHTHQMPSWKNLIDAVKHLDMDLLVNFVKENIGTFMSVLESLWAVLKGNITLALHILTSSLSLVFGGGTAVLNFVLSFVIFSTALFYLLCSSEKVYKPSELVNKLVPQTDAGTKFAEAVEEAVNGVFAASIKMATFYGLYTWFIHTLFEVRIIYIPSVLAALFGAVPFLGAYWACLPAILELWLEHGQGLKALLMLGCQFLPSFFVDSQIYSEIKGAGHPYLTGLAIAGGVFYSGFEGALYGPLLLCTMFVIMNVYTNMMQGPSGKFWRTGRYGFRRMLTIE